MRFFPAALLVLAACSSPVAESASAGPPAAAGQSARHPVSGLAVVPLRITQGDTVHDFRVEVALSGEEQARGLMFRTEMAADEGMIFPYRPARPASFWMKNTVIPLDLIFVGPDGRIINIAANATPYSLDSIPSAGPVSAVLELNGGRAAELGIEAGATVAWEGVPR